MKLIKNKKLLVIGLVLFLGVSATVAYANHAWGKYHWDISTADSEINPLKLGNNLDTSAWDDSLAVASVDWNDSVLKNQVVDGSGTACDPVLGSVEVCNSEYGDNNWLGIAQIAIYRGRSGHIAWGLVKVNDYYFNQEKYGTQSWKDYVMCQEVGHIFGLSHQDENFENANLGTCMDYTSDPDGITLGPLDNLHPNDHDYDMLASIYAHQNETDDGGTKPGKGNGRGKNKSEEVRADIDLNNPSAWGQAMKQDARGNDSLFERDLGNGQVLITYVIWAD